MKSKLIIAVCLLLSMFSVTVFADVTGSISGTVTDSKTGEPLVGVSVAVKGSTRGGKTSVGGRYNILNLPVGDYTLVFSSVGYGTLEVEGIHVSADLATKENRELTEEVTETGKVVTVTAERPMIIADKTTTVDIISGEDLQLMPVRNFEEMIGLQNSVVRSRSNVDIRQRGNRESMSSGGEINLRGGRPSEVAYYVDGFSVQDPLSGLSTASISNNAIAELSVTSGTFSAEYGHVASGIVNVITNSGTESYHGDLDLSTDNFIGDSYDQNFYSANLGGPIPGIGGNFFVSGERRWMADRSPSIMTKEIYEEFSLDSMFTDLHRLPSNSLSGWSGQAKLSFDLKENMKLSLTGVGSYDEWQEYRHAWLFNYENSPRYEDKDLTLSAKITHNLSSESFYNLSASYHETERIRADGVIWRDIAAYNRGEAQVEWDEWVLFRDSDSYWNNFLHRKSNYIAVKGDYTKQLGIYNTVKTGFDFQRHELRYFENLSITDGFSTKLTNRYGFDQNAQESDTLGWMNEAKNPINFGAYIQEKFDWGGLVVNAGLRFDMFDYKSLRIKDFENPLDPGNLTGFDVLEKSDLEESKVFTRVSPRLGIGFPVSDKTQIHVNYGKFFQRPDLRRLYLGYDFMEVRLITPGSFYPFSNPNLEPEKVTQYEAGFETRVGEDAVFGVTAYYKDVQDQTQAFTQKPAFPNQYDLYANTDFGTIKGVDFSLTMRRSRFFRADIKYTLSWANGTGSNPNSTSIVAWQSPGNTPKTTAPLDYDQRHNITALVDFRTGKGEGPIFGNSHPFENMSINAVIQMASGTPYSPMKVYDGVTNGPVALEPTGAINSGNLPWTANVDLRAERKFNFAGYSISPYIWVQNLFDAENVYAVYEGTGEPGTTGYLSTQIGVNTIRNETAGYEQAYRLDEQNPKNWGKPRMILFGLRMSF